MKLKQLGTVVLVAVCLGLLEAAWTSPTAGGPRDPMLGCFAIAVVLTVVSWPRLWLVPGLGILEEMIQAFVGTLGVWRPNLDTVFHHWSIAYIGFNVYPYILFPLITVIGETAYRWSVLKPYGFTGADPDETAKG